MVLVAEKNKYGYCPKCGAKLDEYDYSIQEKYDDTIYLTLTCPDCKEVVEESYSYSNSCIWANGD